MDRIVYILYRGARAMIAFLPIGFIFRLGTGLGWLAHMALPSYRRLATANLTIAFGAEKSRSEIRRMARTHFLRLGANLLSGVKLATMSRKEILEHVTVEGMQNFEAATTGGRGFIAIVSHLGNWEALAQAMPLALPCKLGSIYQHLGNRYIDADVLAARARLGLELFERKGGLLASNAFVRRGGGLGVLVDQHAGDGGIWCPLFGRLASTSPFAATVALRSRADLVPIAIYTVKPGYWRMVIEPHLQTQSRDLAEVTMEINLALEKQIRRSPEDWFWVHNRWKTPKPNFMLAKYRRGIALPKEVDPARLNPFRIVIRSGNWLGDAVMSTPAVQAIKYGRPDIRLTVLTKANLVEYWKRVPEVDEVIPIDPGDSVFSVASKLRGKFEVAIIFPNSIRTGLEAWLAGIPRRIAYPAKFRNLLVNQLVPPAARKPVPARHQVYRYLELARSIGIDTNTPGTADESGFFPSVNKPISSAARVKIGLCPGAEYGPAKRWLSERFAETARAVAERIDCEWVLFGVAGDAAVGDEIARHLDGHAHFTNFIGKTTLAELMDQLSECSLLLTNDTGTMHLAAFLGVPTIAIFGSTEPRLTGPLGAGHQVMRHQVECSPCFQRDCPLDFRCMKAVTVEETVRAVFCALARNSALVFKQL